MEKRIAKQTPRTFRLAAGILLLALALPGAALAFKSAYSSITMPGTFDSGPQWDTWTHELALVSDYVWEGLVEVTRAGEFKFAANKSWDIANWGIGQDVSVVPTVDMGPLEFKGVNNIRMKLAAGKYRFVFFEDTATFSVLPASSTPPSYSKVQLVGSFNDEGALDTGAMASKGNGVWTATVSNLSYGATIRVNADGTIYGAHSAKAASLSSMPATVALYGTTEVLLQSQGGTFEFSMDFRSNRLSVVQTETNAFTLAVAGADGTFACSTNLPGQNLEDHGDNWWQGDFQVEQSGFTLRFVGRDKDGAPGRWWGFPAGTTITTLPVDGTLAPSNTPDGASFATFNTGAGDYTFRFNPQSGSYTVRKRALSNLFHNASFEKLDGNGNPEGWGLYHAGNAPSSVYDAHSGTNSAVLNRLYDDWDNLGNIDQNVTLKDKEGLPFRVAAAFRCGRSAWHGDTVRIIIEWKQGNTILSEESTEVLNLSPAWQTVALETTVPTNNVTAHVLFKYDGAQVGETVLIDDAYAGIAASRTQNFDAWGRHDKFEKIDPDWSASSAQTILNAAATIPGGVLISRYIESVGNTKAIEIYNGTSSAINLKTTPYYLQQYDNGATSPTVTIALTNGTIPAGRTFAVTRTLDATNYPPDSALRSFGAIGGLSTRILRTDKLTFNGDDVIVLSKGATPGATIVDRVGQVSPNATGSLWSRMATDHTLVRNGTVTNGTTSAVTSAFDLSEWTVLDNGDFGDLGAHAFTDPDAGYLPSGYSLLLNTNANLATPSLDGGIGDISFLARAQGATTGDDLLLVIETASDEYSTSWTQVATVAIPLSQTEFTRYECSAGNADHTVVRFRHVGDGTTNRVRLDDIEIGRAYRIKRTENFAGWTAAAYRIDGLHSVAQWTLSGHIASNGVSGTLAGNLPVDSGYVQTPTFGGGVGEITFALCRPASNTSVQVTLSVSGDGGNTWDDVQTFEYPAKAQGLTTNLSAWVYVPSNACAKFTCDGGTADAILDNISVGLPALSRVIDFESFAANYDDSKSPSYGSYLYNGWTFTDMAVYNGTNSYSGNAGTLRNGTITSPRMETIGSISFVYHVARFSNDSSAKLKVEVSTNGTSWSILTNGLSPSSSWKTFAYLFKTNTHCHYVRISQTSKDKRILLDNVALNDFAPIPSVSFSCALSNAVPSANEPFWLTATAYPHNGAKIEDVIGHVKIDTGRSEDVTMSDEGAGDWKSAPMMAPEGGKPIVYSATVRYSGIGVLPNNPGYATNTYSTPSTTVTVSSVRSGEVWINEISYERLRPNDNGDPWTNDNQDHEFIEICGKKEINLYGWKIQLAYAYPQDILANSNQAIYASYTITNNPVISDAGSGYGFWLLADDAIGGADQNLSVLDPLVDDFFAEDYRSHIHDEAGVIRLVNQYGGVVQSLSYGAYAAGSDPITPHQLNDRTNCTLSLTGNGSTYSSFTWSSTVALSPGTTNGGQTITFTNTTVFMPVWHDPTLPVTTSKNDYFMFNPRKACQRDNVQVFFAYSTNDFDKYEDVGGTLHHRKANGVWTTTSKQNTFNPNTNPTNDEAYFAFLPIDSYTYHRGDTMEYVIEAFSYDDTRYSRTFFGCTNGVCTSYADLDTAMKHPFKYYFDIEEIVIDQLVFNNDGTIFFHASGNNYDNEHNPLTVFRVLATTNLMTTDRWPESSIRFTHEHIQEPSPSGQGTIWCDTFSSTEAPTNTALHFAIQPIR